VAEAQNMGEPKTPTEVATTRLLPQPASFPKRQKTEAKPAESVLSCATRAPSPPEVADRSPSLRVTVKVTSLPAKG
jgi:hypothetical protein